MTHELTLNAYQEKAMTTCMDSCDNVSYMLLNLVAEVGEFAGKLAKAIRKGHIKIDNNHLYVLNNEIEDELLCALKGEAGDIMWQLCGLIQVLGWTAEDVGIDNIDKLASRKRRGVIDGNGDNR
jgi:NTP pyrophosphatase (non-canonical NTP hydrolase)